jgi:hypothetical protein
MDHLWRSMKQKVCANRKETSIDALVTRGLRYLRGLPQRAILRKADVLSRAFRLRVAASK